MGQKILLIFLLLLPVLAFADKTEDQLKSFLQSRKVVDQVYFTTASSQLSAASRQKLNQMVPTLEKIDRKEYLLRVEGFASPEGSVAKNVNLSMERAMAVRNYFRDVHGLSLDLFLTGYGGAKSATNVDASRRVDIAVYRQAQAAMALFDEQGTVEKIVLK